MDLMNHELKSVNAWFLNNKLSLNTTKTNYNLFRTHRKKLPNTNRVLQIDTIILLCTSSAKFLGIHVDQFLSWNEHISNVSSKVTRSIFSRVSRLLPSNILLQLYFTLVKPYLVYCNLVWAPNYPTRLRNLNILQRKALRTITRTHQRYHIGPTLCWPI